MASVVGRVQSVIHQSSDFYILAFETGSFDSNKKWFPMGKPTKVCGNIVGLDFLVPGVTLEVIGQWINHPKFGRQLSVSGWRPWANNKTAVGRFLQCVPGFLNPNFIDKVVNKFEMDTFRVLSHESEKVLALADENFTEEAILQSIDSWQELRASYELALFLQDHRISSALIRSILNTFGSDALRVVSENPYRLLNVEGFNFLRVDDVARRMGVEPTDKRRLEGVLLWVFRQESQSGHLFTRRGDLIRLVGEVLKGSEDGLSSFNLTTDLNEALKNLYQQKAIVIENGVGCYLPEYHRFERESARKLAEFIAPLDLEVDLVAFLEDYQKTNNIELSEAQIEAVEKLAKNKVLVLTGLPGTGKTTVIRCLVALLQAAHIRFTLMAPTGIAAKRLSAVTQQAAATIHRTLQYNGTGWGYCGSNKFPISAVIVDEMSMVDQELVYRILDSLDPATIVVLVGDDAQLPSVGPGNVLRELLSSTDVPNVRLTKIFRQAGESMIVRNSHRINGGEDIEYTTDGNSEFLFIPMTSEEQITESIVQLASKLKSRDANFQVLAPKYDGTVGVNNLNLCLREQLNPDHGQKWASFGDLLHVREGDRVMIVKNNYEMNVYNGDMAKLLTIEEKDLVLKVHGGGLEGLDSIIRVPRSEAGVMLKLAYCITVHKSQGSEFDTVILPITQSQGRMLQRNLLYTAITRAKRKVYLLGEASAVTKAIANNKVVQRNTVLAQAIHTAIEAGVAGETK